MTTASNAKQMVLQIQSKKFGFESIIETEEIKKAIRCISEELGTVGFCDQVPFEAGLMLVEKTASHCTGGRWKRKRAGLL